MKAFRIPVSYNSKVQWWIKYFQGPGKSSFTRYLERSSRHLPVLKRTLRNEGLPQDLAYLSMIESGFSAHAASSANAVGPWQFIRETGLRYGLKISWWLDERRDFQKSTIAAAKYLKKMYGMFNNWYLVAAGYNAGESRVVRAIQRNQSHNFWKLSQNEFADETKEYVPKFIAALLIAKSPEMYGFRDIHYREPLSFEHFRIPGGTKLNDIADAIGVTRKHMAELNPELLHGYVPNHVDSHLIRVPKGSVQLVSYYIRKNFVTSR
jgi:membrane-bound lytic murein transglycosylase D